MREIAAWLGYVFPKHEAGNLIQQITKGTLSATEAWTDGRHAEDDKHVELECELAVARANVTESAARSAVLKVTQVETTHHNSPHMQHPEVQGRKGIEGEAHVMVLECG